MANLHIIWKSLSLNLIGASVLLLSNPAHACDALKDGVYVADSDANSLTDGGQWSRVVKELTLGEKKFFGTTGQFDLAYVIKDGQITLYRGISNALDEHYETLYSAIPVQSAGSCDGKFVLDMVFDRYYTSVLKIGQTSPAKKPKSTDPIKAHIEGHVLTDGNLHLDTCQAFEQRTTGWRKTSDDLGMCGGGNKTTLFNIKDKVVGQKGWESIK